MAGECIDGVPRRKLNVFFLCDIWPSHLGLVTMHSLTSGGFISIVSQVFINMVMRTGVRGKIAVMLKRTEI